MAVYVTGQVTVTDPSWIEDYIPKVQAMVEAHGGRYLARNTEIEKLEGPGEAPSVAVILEFPSMEQVKQWYDSAEYAPFKQARQAGSTGTLLLMEGL